MNKKKNVLYCFSPPVMVLTFLFEIAGAVYILLRYKRSRVTFLSIAIMICLAIFQLAEYFVCAGSLFDWAKVGFIAITLLPPLGLHLAASIVSIKRGIPSYVFISYMTALCFISFFVLYDNAITAQICGGNYIIFGMTNMTAWVYGVYYYGWLVIATAMCLLWSRQIKDKNKQKSLNWLCIGYSTFLIPTTTVNIADPNTIKAIPSIMCGFAVLLAFIIIIKVLPPVAVKRNQ